MSENELLELSCFELLELLLDKIGNDFNDFMDFYEGDDPKFEVKIETHKYKVRKKLYRDSYGEEYYDEHFMVYGGKVFSVHSYDVDEFVDYILSSDDYEDYKSIIEHIEPFVFYRISYYTINAQGELVGGGIGGESLMCFDAEEVEISLLNDIKYFGERLATDLDSVEANVWIEDADDDLMSIYERVKAEALKYEKGE